jgi:hypothetical protein
MLGDFVVVKRTGSVHAIIAITMFIYMLASIFSPPPPCSAALLLICPAIFFIEVLHVDLYGRFVMREKYCARNIKKRNRT